MFKWALETKETQNFPDIKILICVPLLPIKIGHTRLMNKPYSAFLEFRHSMIVVHTVSANLYLLRVDGTADAIPGGQRP